jgi:hypothetical protein
MLNTVSFQRESARLPGFLVLSLIAGSMLQGPLDEPGWPLE